MAKLDTAIHLDVGQFFRWWGGELAFLVPLPLRKLLGGVREYLVLDKTGPELRVSHLHPEGELVLGQLATDEPASGFRERILEAHPKLAEVPVVLRLAPGQALRKFIKLPAATEENLNQVVAFEMDRLAPFKADQVYFGTRVKSRLSATRQILVELVLTPRDKLDTLLEEVTAAGFRPDIVDMAGEDPPGAVNLLPPKYRRVRRRWLHWLQIGLSVVILALLVALAVVPILIQRDEVEALEEQVRKATRLAKEVETLRQEVETLEHQTQFLQEKKRTEPVAVDMLEELSRVIPNSTWLNGLQYKDRRIVIQGQSPSASSLIELIEASRHFKNTSFVSPVTKDTASGLERFQIASDVINGRFSEDPDGKAVPAEKANPHQ